MASKPDNPADWFGTFLDSVGKLSNPRTGGDDISNRILLALRSGAVAPSGLVAVADNSLTALTDALSALEKLGMIRYEDGPDGKLITLTADGKRTVDQLASGGSRGRSGMSSLP